MSTENAQSTLSAPSNTQGKVVGSKQFKVSDIPAAMDKMNWPVAAALMRHWFKGNPWPVPGGGMDPKVKAHAAWPPLQYIEENIVKMKWVAGFDRAKSVIDDLRINWNNSAAQLQIKNNIAREYSGRPAGCYRLTFDGLASKAERFGYFNSRAVTFSQVGNDELNDLRGALANFNIRVVAEGGVDVYHDRVIFTPDTLAFYVEDNYDFNDDGAWISQPLGYWNFEGIAPSVTEATLHNAGVDGITRSIENQSLFGMSESNQRRYQDIQRKRYFLVQNNDFVKYRAAYGKGGDFRVFSDVLYERLPSPSAIVIPRRR